MKMTKDMVPAEFRKWVGRRYDVEDQYQRAEQMAFSMINEGLARTGSPFWTMSVNGLLLNDQTADYLYRGDYGMTELNYKQGTFPVLEAYIKELTTPDMTDKQKVIALSQSMHYYLPKKYPKVPVFLYNESDEHTLLKGGGHCSCRGRLLTSLCQIMGIQARPVTQCPWIDRDRDAKKLLGGHTVVEVFLDGNWGFFDPQGSLFAMTEDGRIPSCWEIKQNREIFLSTPQHIKDQSQLNGYGVSKGEMSNWEYYWYKNFNPRCPMQISRYDNSASYTPGWLWATPELREKQAHDYALLQEILYDMASRNEITDEIYKTMSKNDFIKLLNITNTKLPSLETFAA